MAKEQKNIGIIRNSLGPKNDGSKTILIIKELSQIRIIDTMLLDYEDMIYFDFSEEWFDYNFLK